MSEPPAKQHEGIDEEHRLWSDIQEKISTLGKSIDRALTLHNEAVHSDDVNTLEFYQCQYITKMLGEFDKTISLLRGKYTIEIMFVLYTMQNPYFNQILKALPQLNSNTLSQRLKTLEEHQIIDRELYETTPIRVSYSLSKIGRRLYLLLYPLFFTMHSLKHNPISGRSSDDYRPNVEYSE